MKNNLSNKHPIYVHVEYYINAKAEITLEDT